jgi:hypothetical protein
MNGVTYGDWYLPSIAELNLLYQQRSVVGGFTYWSYWSSSEYDGINAWDIDFGTGTLIYYGKGSTYYVRAVRAF